MHASAIVTHATTTTTVARRRFSSSTHPTKNSEIIHNKAKVVRSAGARASAAGGHKKPMVRRNRVRTGPRTLALALGAKRANRKRYA